MRHIWSVACLRSIVDKETNSISLIDSLEEITVQVPADQEGQSFRFPGPIEIVSYFERSDQQAPEEGFGIIEYLNPNNDVLRSLNFNISLNDFIRTRHRAKVAGFDIPGEGRYSFRVGIRSNEAEEWETVSTIPLTVTVQRVAQVE